MACLLRVTRICPKLESEFPVIETIISFADEAKIGGYGDLFPFKPCLVARQGSMEFRAWVELTGMAGEILRQKIGGDDPDKHIKRAMLRYGIRRLEPLLQDLISNGAVAETVHPTWRLEKNDYPMLMELAFTKTCEYQRRVSRDLFCMISAIDDSTAVTDVDGRKVSPTSRPICYFCDLPDTDFLCSHLLHPATMGQRPKYGREISQALCDLDRAEVRQPAGCHLGGYSCCRRILEIKVRQPTTARLSALGLPESFDVLDAHWRLTFGRSRRLLVPSTLTGPSSLVLDCESRDDFISRIGALAATMDRLKVDDDLLPDNISEDRKNGSLNRLEASLILRLASEQHDAIMRSIQTLRRVRQARNAGSHDAAEWGLTERLATLGIVDAPPKWNEAWDSIKAMTIDALTAIRNEMRQWFEAQDI
jgi:hypothetical protein